MLEQFRAAKQTEIKTLREQARSKTLPDIYTGPRPSFALALGRGNRGGVIAEYKPASPSQGVIRRDIRPREMARIYHSGGARAVSVLTETRYFQSSLSYLEEMAGVGLPLLRKDFLFDPLQIRQTATTPASALLLIARMFEARADALAALIEEAQHFGLETVVEIFDVSDLALARGAEARIIQVNNRDLASLKVDLDNSRTLIAGKRDHEVWIAASGFSRPAEVREMADLGFEACLIGTSIMRSPDPSRTLRELAGSG